MSVTEADIFNRVIDPSNPTLSPDAAKAILQLGYAEADHTRMAELSRKSDEGMLTPDPYTLDPTQDPSSVRVAVGLVECNWQVFKTVMDPATNKPKSREKVPTLSASQPGDEEARRAVAVGTRLQAAAVDRGSEGGVGSAEVVDGEGRLAAERCGDDPLVLPARDGARGIDERPAAPKRVPASGEDPLLQGREAGDRFGVLAPPRVRPRRERAEVRAGRVHEDAIVTRADVGARGIAHDDRHVLGTEPLA